MGKGGEMHSLGETASSSSRGSGWAPHAAKRALRRCGGAAKGGALTVRPRWVTHHTSVTGGETLTHWVASTCFALGGTAACVASAASSILALCAALQAAFLGLQVPSPQHPTPPPEYRPNQEPYP